MPLTVTQWDSRTVLSSDFDSEIVSELQSVDCWEQHLE